jgi:hypothetical protein
MAIDINIPSQVKNYANLAGFPATGSLKTIFIAEDTNKTYRWTGSAYVEISASQATAWGAITGTLSSQTDLNTALSGKVPTTRTLTINGTTQDLSADRTFTISTGITIGTTAITSGTVGRILFEGTGNVVQESANLFWDNTNGRLGIGTSSPISKLHIVGDTNIIYQQASTTGFTGKLYYAFKSGGVSGEAMSLFGDFVGGVASAFAFSNASGTTIMQIRNGGNVQIGTTTDAGFKLDVNGTARVSGDFNVGGSAQSGYQFRLTNSAFFGGSLRVDGGIQGNTSLTIVGPTILTGGQTTVRDGNKLLVGGTSGSVADASALSEVRSTTKGFLPPRMTTTEKNAIATPAEGLQVWDTTLKLMFVYNGTTWISL